MNRTKIPWTDYSWNPVVGCTPCSPGCANCYAKALHDKRHKAFMVNVELPGQYVRPFGTIQCFPDRLDEPLRLRKPSKIFVCSMSDLFHEDVNVNFINKVLMTIDAAPRHTFQLLTKRIDRAARLLTAGELGVLSPNAWPGVTICDQDEADAKIPALLSIPAAVRWLSIEPMLSEIIFSDDVLAPTPRCDGCGRSTSGMVMGDTHEVLNSTDDRFPEYCGIYKQVLGIDWVVVGCESGPHRRPCNVEWVRSVVEQCKAAGCPVFVKQLDIGGKVITDPAQFPENLRIREYPK